MHNIYLLLSEVIEQRRDPSALANALDNLEDFLGNCEDGVVDATYDSVMMPLMVIMKSMMRIKVRKGVGEIHYPAAKSDRVNERALGCLNLLLGRKSHTECQEFLQLLYTMADILLLKKDNASEELRISALKCFITLLEGSEYSKENLLEGFKEGNAAQVVCFIVHQCMCRAREEGPKGSKEIVSGAFLVVDLFLRKIPFASVWREFLPGCAGELSGFLTQAGLFLGHSGAPKMATSAIVNALRALFGVIHITLNDRIVKNVKPSDKTSAGPSLEAIMQQVKDLELNGSEQTTTEKNDHTNFKEDAVPIPDGSWEWCEYSRDKLHPLLEKCLPKLVAHPSMSARSELAKGVVLLLKECSIAFETLQDTLLQILLTLSQDEWDKVSDPCQQYLQTLQEAFMGSPECGNGLQATVEKCVRKMSGDLHRHVRSGGSEGISAARHLASAMEVAGFDLVCRVLISNPVRLSAFCNSMSDCFSFEPHAASSLLHSISEPGTHIITHQNSTHTNPKPTTPNEDALCVMNGHNDVKNEENECGAEGVSSVLLPRMPVSLLYITTDEMHQAVSKVARMCGSLCAVGEEKYRGLSTVVDALMQQIHQISESKSEHWALNVASTISVLSELLFGASLAKFPNNVRQKSEANKTDLGKTVYQILDAFASGPLWNLKTFNEDGEDNSEMLSTQVLGEHALLLRSLLDCTGVCARVLQENFVKGGKLLRLVLMRVLERLGDPCDFVQASAEAAVGSICNHCGYGSLGELVSANGDYVVDGLCAQLRCMHAYPRSPYLFAALMKRSEVAPKLLPLLAEPGRLALKGIGIVSRGSTPHYTPAFLKALLEICMCVNVEGSRAMEWAEKGAQILNARIEEQEKQKEDNKPSDTGGTPTMSEIQEFFPNSNAENVADAIENGGDEFEQDSAVVLTLEEEEELNERVYKTHNAAILASSIVDLVAPIVLAKDTRASLLAMSAAMTAVHSLRSTTRSCTINDEMREHHIPKHKAAASPVAPETPKLLPSLHILWTPLMAALKDRRTPVLESSLQLLKAMTIASEGSFLARRISTEAWPVLRNLIVSGMAGGDSSGIRHKLELDFESGSSPNAVFRVRKAVLECISEIAQDKEGGSVLTLIVDQLVDVIVPYIGKSHVTALREVASQTLAMLGKVDPDVVWVTLMDLAANDPDSEVILECPDEDMFPSFNKVVPQAPRASATGIAFGRRNVERGNERLGASIVTRELAVDCGRRAAGILNVIAKEDAAWHGRVREALDVGVSGCM